MLNVAIVMGRFVKNPEIRETPNGVTVCTFRLAVERSYQKSEEKQVDFIDVVAWRETAEFINKYFQKGSMIIVEGRIQTRSYEDKQGGKRTAVEIVASNVQFGETKAAREQSTAQQPTYAAPQNQPMYPAQPAPGMQQPYSAPAYQGQGYPNQPPAYQQQPLYPPQQYQQSASPAYMPYANGDTRDFTTANYSDSDDLPF